MEMKAVTPTWLRQVATALSSRYGVVVREGKGWAMDVDRQILTYKPEHLLALDRDTCLGILLHELGHLHFTTNDWTDTAKLFKDSNLKDICFNAVNAFEDVRINEKMSQSYGGSRELIDSMNELLGGDGVAKFVDMSTKIKNGSHNREGYSVPDWHEVFYIAMAKLLGQFPQFQPEAYYNPDKLRIVNEIVNAFRQAGLDQADSTQDIYDFVENEVFPRIQEFLPEPAPQSGGGKGSEPDGEKEETEAEPNSTAEGNTDGDGTVEQDDGEQGDGNTGGASNEPEPDQPDQEQPKSPQRGGNGVHGGEDMWKRELEEKIQKAIARGRVNPDEQHRTKPFGERGQSRQPEQRVANICNVDTHEADSVALQSKFRNKFEAVFRDNSYARYTANQRSGRLNNRVLYKHRLNNNRLFKRKLTKAGKSYAVAFGMDLSGSMYEKQIRGSFHAMLAFTKTLDRLKIPYGIGFFSHVSTIGKHFANKTVVNRKLGQSATEVLNGGTAPDKLLQELFGKELAQQNVEEKIGVLLTDGMWSKHSYDALHELKKKHPEIHLYLVTLGMHPDDNERVAEIIGSTATLLASDTPDGIVERYIEIAKKHLL